MNKLINVLIVWVILGLLNSTSINQLNAASSKTTTNPNYPAYLGTWQTIDDKTNRPRSLVSIKIKNKQLVATIIKIFPAEGETSEPTCDNCQGKLKGVNIVGLNILNNMVFEDNQWQGGEILDPNNGKYYDAKIWLEDNKLQVRGYIGFFFRTQQWLRVEHD
jgi:uncharacterized protein (DUF2147 family)